MIVVIQLIDLMCCMWGHITLTNGSQSNEITNKNMTHLTKTNIQCESKKVAPPKKKRFVIFLLVVNLIIQSIEVG